MKKFVIPAGLLCTAAVATTIVYRRLKKDSKHEIIFNPMGRYVKHLDQTPVGLKILSERSDLIIHGRIKHSGNVRWNNRDNKKPRSISTKDLVYQDYFIEPISFLKGELPEHSGAILRSFEGYIGDYSVEDNSQPKLAEGQEVIAFLQKGSKKDFKYDERPFYVLTENLSGLLLQEGENFQNPYAIFQLDEIISEIE